MPRSRVPLPRLRFVPAILALAASPAVADVEKVEWPDGLDGGHGPFTGITLAQVGPPGSLVDAVMVTDGEVVVAAGIAHFSLLMEVSTTGTAIDVATLPVAALAVEDDRDHLILAASDGLWTLRADVNGVLQPTAVDTSSGWQGVKRIVVADVDADDDADILVLKSNGRSIDCKLQTSTGGWADTSDYQWTANFDVIDFAVADVDGDSSDVELVANDTRALRILSPGNSLLAGYASVKATFDRMAIVRADSRGGISTAVAWVTASSATPSDPWRSLYLVTTAGATWCATTDAPLGPMVGGHFDDQAGSDLAFVVDGESTIQALLQQDATPPFDFEIEHGWSFSLGGSSAVAAWRPAVGDIGDVEDDGIEELVLPLASGNGAVALITQPEYMAIGGNPDYSHSEHCAAKWPLTSQVADVKIIASFPGATLYEEEGGWQVDCTIWRQEGDLSGEFDSEFVRSCRTPLGEMLTATDTVEVEFQVENDHDLYYILVRVVHLDENDEIDEFKPFLLGVYSADEGDVDELYNEDYEFQPLWNTGSVAVHLCAGGSAPPRVGGFIRIRRFPPSIPPPASPPTGDCN